MTELKIELNQIFSQVKEFEGVSGMLHLGDKRATEVKVNRTSHRKIWFMFKETKEKDFNLECCCCGAKASHFRYDYQYKRLSLIMDNNYDLTVDHIIPKSKGGDDNLDNFQLMCKDCNNYKGNSKIENMTLLYYFIKLKKLYFKLKRVTDYKKRKGKFKKKLNSISITALHFGYVVL